MAYKPRRRTARRSTTSRRAYSAPRRSTRRSSSRRGARSRRSRSSPQTVRIVLQTTASPQLGDASVGLVRSGRAKF